MNHGDDLTFAERIGALRVRYFLALVGGLGAIEGCLAILVAHEVNEWPIGRWGIAFIAAFLLLGGYIGFLHFLRDHGRAVRIGALEHEVIAEKARTRTLIGESFDSILDSLARQASRKPGRREPDAASVKTALLASAAGLLGPERTRANFYLYYDNQVDGQPRIRELRLRGCHGRKQGRSSFSYNKPDGNYAIKCISKDLPFGVTDVEEDAPEWFDHDRHRGTYRSFIAMPVKTSGQRPLGMLTVDSPEPNAFGPADYDLLRVFAQIMAVSLLVLSDTDHVEESALGE